MHRPDTSYARCMPSVQTAQMTKTLSEGLGLVGGGWFRPGETVDAIRAVLPGFNVWRSPDWWPTPEGKEQGEEEEEEPQQQQQQQGSEEGKGEL